MPDQCRAVTDDGERCSRPAEEDGFCHQHGPENETVDDAAADEADAETESDDATAEADGGAKAETDGGAAAAEADADATGEAGGDDSDADDSDGDETSSESDEESDLQGADIVAIRNKVRDQVPELIGRELDGVTGLMQDDDGWVATVELVERHSVPDTQDILGQYEVTITDDATIRGYRRLDTYRRADGSPQEF